VYTVVRVSGSGFRVSCSALQCNRSSRAPNNLISDRCRANMHIKSIRGQIVALTPKTLSCALFAQKWPSTLTFSARAGGDSCHEVGAGSPASPPCPSPSSFGDDDAPPPKPACVSIGTAPFPTRTYPPPGSADAARRWSAVSRPASRSGVFSFSVSWKWHR